MDNLPDKVAWWGYLIYWSPVWMPLVYSWFSDWIDLRALDRKQLYRKAFVNRQRYTFLMTAFGKS